MTFDEALELGSRGVRVCRPGFGEEFCLVQEGRIVRGGFMGEASLARMRFWEPSAEDRQAPDWRRFRRELPDEWERLRHAGGRADGAPRRRHCTLTGCWLGSGYPLGARPPC